MQQHQPSDGTSQIDARYWLHNLWAGKWIILACTILATAVAFVKVHFQIVSYRAQAQVQVDAPPFLPSPGMDISSQSSYYSNIDRYFKTERQKLTSNRMHLMFAERLRTKDARYQYLSSESIASDFAGGLSLQPVEDTNLLWLDFIADNPEKASEWVNLYVDVYVAENDRLQGEAVHAAGKRNAEMIITGPAEILDGRGEAGIDDLNAHGAPSQACGCNRRCRVRTR